MEAGLPYRPAHPDAYVDGYPWPNPQHVGAHDLAPTASSALDPFAHWRVLGLTPPTVTMADDLSNLDLFVELAMMGFS